MIKQYIKQAFKMLTQNKFFSIVSIVGTALTIAFVMVIFMMYDINTANLSPEENRDRIIYSGEGYSFRVKDNSHCNSGMSLKAAKSIFGALPHASVVSYSKSLNTVYAGGTIDNGVKRRVMKSDSFLWKIYNYEFISGRPFNDEEVNAVRKVAVITERVARQAFYTIDVVGKSILIDFEPFRIVGVVKDVSSLYYKAYADIWIPLNMEDKYINESEGMLGSFRATVIANSKTDVARVKDEIKTNIDKLNKTLTEYKFELKTYTQDEVAFTNNFNIRPKWMFLFLGLILLIVPAINISGLLSSQMKKRFVEIGVRKAYGAHQREILFQLITENFVLALMGGVIGFVLSCVALSIFKVWLLASSSALYSMDSLDVSIFLFLRPVVFLLIFIICMLFNLLSVFIPAYYASRKNIVDILKGE